MEISDEVIAHIVEEIAKILSGAPFPSARSYAKARQIYDDVFQAAILLVVEELVGDELTADDNTAYMHAGGYLYVEGSNDRRDDILAKVKK